MSALLYGIALQWKLDIRNKGVLLTYYGVPLMFFAFMGGIFSSINPEARDTLIQTMTVFGVTMAAFLGAPAPLVELLGSDIKKAYRVGGIPLWAALINNFSAAFIHIFMMSLVIFFVSPAAFDAKSPANPAVNFISLAIFIIVSLMVGTIFGLYVKSSSKLTIMSQLLFLPSIMLSGIMFPVSMLPSMLEYAGMILPATWGFKLMSGEVFDIKLLIPLIVILLVSIFLNVYKLLRIRLE
ncbi:MAG: ABC transporter permease [Clostridiaceae bacterium]|nr:ABC transporter permease [Clostridiaceae bacterium]